MENSGCLFLFEGNDEDQKSKDDIQDDDGLFDFDTNNGYILGMPFLRAFNIFFDFEANNVGFATKKVNYGAEITSTDLHNLPDK